MLISLFPKAYAQAPSIVSPGGGSALSFEQLLRNINTAIVSPLIYLMFALALFYFLWGVFVFIQNAESPEKREEGGKSILWGLVGMAIMLSVKGIINLSLIHI